MKHLYKVLDILILSIPFIDGAYSLETDFLCFRASYIIYFLYLIFHFKEISSINFSQIFKDKFYKNIFVWALFIILVSSAVNVYLNNNTIVLLLKQIIVISFVAFTVWIFFRVNKNDVKYIINIYLKIAFVVSCIGIFQEFSYLIGFKYGYDFSYFKILEQIGSAGKYVMRVTSVCSEPACLCAMIPAFYISLNSYLTNKKSIVNNFYFFIITVCLLLTYSSLVYLGIVLSFISVFLWNYKLIKLKKVVIFIFFSFFTASFGFSQIEGRISGLFIKNKTDAASGVETVVKNNVQKQKQPVHINRSSYYLLWHFKVAFENFKQYPVFGTGLGSYSKIFQKYGQRFHFDKTVPVLHSKDGASLFIRVMGEMGLFGLTVLFGFLFYNYIKNYSYRNKISYWIMINNAVLVLLLLRVARSAVYFNDGVLIFVWLYCLSMRKFKTEVFLKKTGKSIIF